MVATQVRKRGTTMHRSGDAHTLPDTPRTPHGAPHLTIYRMSFDGCDYVLPSVDEFRRVQADSVRAARAGGELVTVIHDERRHVEILVTAATPLQFETQQYADDAVDDPVSDVFCDFDQFA